MENFSHLRRRRFPSRSEYTLLDDEIDGSQYSHSIRSSMTSDSNLSRSNRLCDRCWLQHTRSPALKHCMECKQNLCHVCARKDSAKRPWWLPVCVVQCMRFLFCNLFKTHTIVDINEVGTRAEHWANRPEASNVNRIPRISRDSLRLRNNSRTPLFTNQNSNQNSNQKRFSSSEEHLIPKGRPRINDERVSRSKSHEEMANRSRFHPRNPKRSISVDKINNRFTRERRERDKIYNQNWDSPSKCNQRAGFRPTHADKPYINKVQGKDIDIVISGSEMKVAVNQNKQPDKHNNKKEQEHKDGFFRKKSKSKAKDGPYEPYTEEIFSDNPIWFKRDSSKKNNQRSNSFKRAIDQTNVIDLGINNGAFEATKEDEQRSYIVQEPPDQCPICLEDLPGQESRTLSCAHVLHTKCLVRYIRETDNLDFGIRCPICKAITKIENYYASRDLWFREVPVSRDM